MALSWTSTNGTDMIGGDFGAYVLFRTEGKFDENTEEFLSEQEVSTVVHEWTEEEFPYHTHFEGRRESRTLNFE